MKFNRYLLGVITPLSICFGQEEDSIFSNTATLRAAVRFAVEVPFNNVALNTVPDGLTAGQSIAHILKQKGIFGFYSGASIEILRSVLLYFRVPLMKNPWRVLMPECFVQYYGFADPALLDKIKKDTDLMWQDRLCFKMRFGRIDGVHISVQLGMFEYDKNISKAANLAAFEMAVMPLFRIRNVLMLYPFQSILNEASNLGKTLYAGSTLRGSITFASWYAFFKTQEHAKDFWEGNPLFQGAVTAGTQMVVGGLVAPLYVVMINRQKLTNPCGLPFFDSMWNTYIKQGSHVFVRSAKFGAANAGMQAALTVGALRLCGEQ